MFMYLLLALPAFLNSAYAQHANDFKDRQSGMPVFVYASSLSGDRLTKKADAYFTADEKSSLPFIQIDEATHYQKIEGFGVFNSECQ